MAITKPAGCMLQFIGAGLLCAAPFVWGGWGTGAGVVVLMLAVVLLAVGRQPAGK